MPSNRVSPNRLRVSVCMFVCCEFVCALACLRGFCWYVPVFVCVCVCASVCVRCVCVRVRVICVILLCGCVCMALVWTQKEHQNDQTPSKTHAKIDQKWCKGSFRALWVADCAKVGPRGHPWRPLWRPPVGGTAPLATTWAKKVIPRVVLGTLRIENCSKNRPAASIRALWVSKIGLLEGSGKVSTNQ